MSINNLTDIISKRNSKNSEAKVCGAVLIYGQEAFQAAKQLVSTDFYDWRFQILWETFFHLGTTPIEMNSVIEALGNNLDKIGGRGFLVSIAQNAARPENIQGYIDAVKKESLSREEIAAHRHIILELESGKREILVNSLQQKLVCLADVQPEAVSWLWTPYLPLRKIILLDGDPGCGKTFFSLQLAAIVSKGWPFIGQDGKPETNQIGPAAVLYLNCEDGIGDTLRPRLDNAGADISKVFILKDVTISDTDILRNALTEVKPKLVVIDPIQNFLGSGVDMNRAESIRPLLSNLGAMASEFECAILVVRHLTKQGKDRTIYRGLGTVDFAAAARSMLLIGNDPEDDTRRVIAHTKSSLAEKGLSLAFKISEGRFEWCGISKVSATEILAPEKEGNDERNAVREAGMFLDMYLIDGPKPMKLIEQEAKQAGISAPSLKRARYQRQIESHKNGNEWYWYTPEQWENRSNKIT